LPRSSFFYQLSRLEASDKYVDVRRAMVDIFERNYRCYGYRRMRASLTGQSVNISENVVRRLMKQEALAPVMRKRRRYGSYMGEISPAPDNLLNRDFSAGCAQPEVAHRYHGISDSGRQGVPVSDDRLPRWLGRQLVDLTCRLSSDQWNLETGALLG